MNENTEVDEDYGNFTRKNTPYPKQLKEMESVAKHLVKEPDTIRKMVSSSSLASSNKGKFATGVAPKVANPFPQNFFSNVYQKKLKWPNHVEIPYLKFPTSSYSDTSK